MQMHAHSCTYSVHLQLDTILNNWKYKTNGMKTKT